MGDLTWNEILKKNLVKILNSLGLSFEYVSSLSGVGRSTISEFNTKLPRLTTIAKIVDTLRQDGHNIPIEEVLEGIMPEVSCVAKSNTCQPLRTEENLTYFGKRIFGYIGEHQDSDILAAYIATARSVEPEAICYPNYLVRWLYNTEIDFMDACCICFSLGLDPEILFDNTKLEY